MLCSDPSCSSRPAICSATIPSRAGHRRKTAAGSSARCGTTFGAATRRSDPPKRAYSRPAATYCGATRGHRRGAPPDDPADLTTRCAGFIKPRHPNALVQVELIIQSLPSQLRSIPALHLAVNLGRSVSLNAAMSTPGNLSEVPSRPRTQSDCACACRLFGHISWQYL